MMRPEVWAYMDEQLISSTAVSQWNRMLANIPAANMAMTTNALAAPSAAFLPTTALLTTVTRISAAREDGGW